MRQLEKKYSVVITLLFLIIAFTSCGARQGKASSVEFIPDNTTTNSVYFWKTRFVLNDYESSFLKEHEVRRVYVKFFDVDDDLAQPYTDLERIVPVATTIFVSDKPDSVEIIPTVFLTVRSISFIAQNEGGSLDAARKIVTRVLNMADFNDMGPVREVQLDCDWTASTKKTFFALCNDVKELLHEKGIVLSSTIRLHQLHSEAPPVDRGVLMLYNTGSIQSASEKNSIISQKEVAKYIQGKHFDFGIPLDFAYPTYSWGLVFRGTHFGGILHQSDFTDTELYAPQEDGSYIVKKEHEIDGEFLSKGLRIRLEESPISEILGVKEMVKKAFPNVPHSNIIYHLDSYNLSKYTTDEISSIYSN